VTQTTRPEFIDLSKAEAVALLQRGHVGRLAFTFHDKVDIEPISYVCVDDSIYGRTSPGTKLTTLKHHPWVAFQVDEVRSRFDWNSVVVRGTLYLLEPTGNEPDREAYERAVEVLRSVDADALTAGDATPHRRLVFRIFIDEIVGKGARRAG